jgi:hypothetical protein
MLLHETIRSMTSRIRVAQHRKAKEAEGYRLVQFWVPDYSNEAYQSELRREWDSINEADAKDRTMDWLEPFIAEVWDDLPDEDWNFGDDDPLSGRPSRA